MKSFLKIRKNNEIKVVRPKKTTSFPKLNNNIINNILKIRRVNEIKQEKIIEKKYTNLKQFIYNIDKKLISIKKYETINKNLNM